MTRFIKIISLLLPLLLSYQQVSAQEETVEMRLIVGETDATPTAGLVLTPMKDWRIYGPPPLGAESEGFAPDINWSESENLSDLELVWPIPQKLSDNDGISYVYTEETLVPMHITPYDPGKAVMLKLKVRLLSCAILCVPVEKELQIRITPGGPENQWVEDVLEEIEEQYEGPSLFMILLVALLGGFILNFMPCVLPVLSLKLMHFAKHKNKANTSHFAMTALGIIASFLFLAIGAIALKASGEIVGWGMHFQNPYFLTFLFIVIILFATNMLGLFEFQIPGKLADRASHAGETSKLKDFFSGVFATLLATPCSAPFVGTSLSFALARDYSDILSVFLALGFGFASPYFIAMLVPSHRFPLPKPGKWMVILQRILGLGLVATAVWLGYVLQAHISTNLLWLILAGTLVILAQLWWQHRITWLTIVLTLMVAASVPFFRHEKDEFNQLPQIKADGACMSLWCAFDEKAIPHLVNQGYTVFVDVTADWCITCGVNKKFVFESPQVTQLLTQPDVIAMRADWTKQNPKITKFLQDNKRFGIPFNIVFGPSALRGIPLPEILTVNQVTTAIKHARGGVSE
jgi:suppressor for copper-sensitivity B